MNARTLATKTATAFRMVCSVRINIAAPPAVIWALLTNAADFPRWNSTVTSITGEIAKGNKLALRVPISERTFTPKVAILEPEVRMVWRDGFAPMFKGERTFVLTPREDSTTDFSMVEVFSGVMLPMIKGTLPDFAPVFDQYAQDLKREVLLTAGCGEAAAPASSATSTVSEQAQAAASTHGPSEPASPPEPTARPGRPRQALGRHLQPVW